MDNTGEPAFPTSAHNLTNDGMTLRDYFAAKAMQGMLANSETDQTFVATASYSYLYADAMLAARKTNG